MKKKIALLALIWIIIDQTSKILITLFLNINSSFTIIPNFFNLTYVINSGAAWSILNNHQILLVILSILALIIITIFMLGFKLNKRNIWSFGLIYGGIIGNLIDRLFHGYVIDFFDFKIFNYNYPVFNIADIGLVVGIIILIIAIFKGEDKSGNNS